MGIQLKHMIILEEKELLICCFQFFRRSSYKGLVYLVLLVPYNKINLFQPGALIDYVLDDLKAQSLLLGRITSNGQS
jgi:hypothetical protein